MSLVRRPVSEEFPKGFHAQRITDSAAIAVAELPSAEISAYFQEHPDTARNLLVESYDKRYSPSTFITEEASGFSVGWYSTHSGYQCVRQFSNLADAATDYLLFSLGRGRWSPGIADSN